MAPDTTSRTMSMEFWLATFVPFALALIVVAFAIDTFVPLAVPFVATSTATVPFVMVVGVLPGMTPEEMYCSSLIKSHWRRSAIAGLYPSLRCGFEEPLVRRTVTTHHCDLQTVIQNITRLHFISLNSDSLRRKNVHKKHRLHKPTS